MNTGEKIAAIYLRLNGFLILPHFTILGGEHHNHVDIIGFHPAGGIEMVNDIEFDRDELFFGHIKEKLENENIDQYPIGLVAESKLNNEIDNPQHADIDYVWKFLGKGTKVITCSFSDKYDDIRVENNGIIIGWNHVLNWIIERFEYMKTKLNHLKKEGSWNLSEDFLADLIVLWKLGFLKPNSGQNY